MKFVKTVLIFLIFLNNLHALKIRKIEIKGNKLIEKDTVLRNISLKKTQNYLDKNVTESVKSLFELGFFEDIKIYKKQVTPNNIDILIKLVEMPIINEIVFIGFDQLDTDDIKDKMKSKENRVLNMSDITSDKQMMKTKYKGLRYNFAQISHDVKIQDKKVVLQFKAVENSKLEIARIKIVGTKYFKPNDLLSKITLKPKTHATAIMSSHIFVEELLMRDLKIIEYFYKDNGFAEVKIEYPSVYFDLERNTVDIIFKIEEGLRYKVKDLDISGDLLFEKDDLKKDIKLKNGDIFSISKFRADMQLLETKYGDLGYANVKIEPIVNLKKELKEVSIEYKINKGEKVYFGDITISGNTKTRDNVIRREFEFYKGQLYNRTNLLKSKRNVYSLGFFEKADIITDIENNIANIDLVLEETLTGEISGSGSIIPSSTSFGSLQGKYKQKNFQGRGWQTHFSTKFQLGSYLNTYTLESDGLIKYLYNYNFNFDAGFVNPRINDSLWSVGSSIFYKNDIKRYMSKSNYHQLILGYRVFVGRLLFNHVHTSLEYKIENISNDFTGYRHVIKKLVTEGISSSIALNLSYNDLNNRMDPSSGLLINFNQKFTGGILLGDNHYIKSTLSSSYYIPIDFISFTSYLKFHSMFSYIYPVHSYPIPDDQRLRLGGLYNLRGYPQDSIGHIVSMRNDPREPNQFVNIGGNKQIYFQIEYVYNILKDIGLRGVLFADIGNVFKEDEFISFNNLYMDVGFGFRLITRVIPPIRFEFAYPVKNATLGDMELVVGFGF